MLVICECWFCLTWWQNSPFSSLVQSHFKPPPNVGWIDLFLLTKLSEMNPDGIWTCQKYDMGWQSEQGFGFFFEFFLFWIYFGLFLVYVVLYSADYSAKIVVALLNFVNVCVSRSDMYVKMPGISLQFSRRYILTNCAEGHLWRHVRLISAF